MKSFLFKLQLKADSQIFVNPCSCGTLGRKNRAAGREGAVKEEVTGDKGGKK